MRCIKVLGGMTALVLLAGTLIVRADDEADADVEGPAPGGGVKAEAKGRSSGDEKKYRDFAEVTKGAAKHDGLFTLHQKDEHLYAEIKPNQFDQPMLAPIMIAQGLPLDTLNKFIPSINAVTSADVTAFAAKYFDATPSLIIVGKAAAFLEPLKKDFPDVRVIPTAELDLNSASLTKTK